MKIGGDLARLACLAAGEAAHQQIDRNVIAAFVLEHGMQRLMNVADKVHGEFQRFDLVVAGGAAQLMAQAIELGDDAKAVFRIVLAIARRIVFWRRKRDVDKMPIRCFRPRIAHVIGPTRHRRQQVAAAQQPLDHARGLRRQPPLRDFGNDGMPLLAPGQSVARERAGKCR
jgi:hypothetical protein